MPNTSQWNWPRLRRLCEREAGRVLRDPADRDDAVQEALIRAWSHRAACRTPLVPDPWVRQIARREAFRLAVTRRRERERWADCAVADRAAAPAPEPAALEERVDLRRAVRALPPDDRALLALRYFGDMTQDQVAGVLGMPVGTVKVRLHRARNRLRCDQAA